MSSFSKRGSQSQMSRGVDFESDEVWYIVTFVVYGNFYRLLVLNLFK